MQQLMEDLKKYEGYRDRVYLDSKGFQTCGWGHHLYVGSRINEIIAEEFLKLDISSAIIEFWKLPIKYRNKLNLVRRRVIVHMIFNMNLPKVLGFVKFWGHVENENWKGAKLEMLNSKWAMEDVGQRAVDLANVFENGK